MSQKPAHNARDLTKEKFGLLQPKYRSGINKHRNALWYCECDCGGSKITTSRSLISLKVKSCGCYHETKPSDEYHNFTGYKELSGNYLNKIKNNAKNRGMSLDVSKEYIYNLYLSQDKKCSMTGISIEISSYKNKEQTASLDRIDSSIGYVEGNLQWIHKTVQPMKMAMNDLDFIKWCKLVAQYRS